MQVTEVSASLASTLQETIWFKLKAAEPPLALKMVVPTPKMDTQVEVDVL